MSTAISRGVQVPSQLSVTGFDDAPLSAYIQPALTTVRTDVVGWGHAAARQLLAVIDHENGADIDLPAPEFVVRGSTAPPCQPGISAPSKDRRASAPTQERTES
jgi:DNA-binding LacI/PurR family transcriptional regulator